MTGETLLTGIRPIGLPSRGSSITPVVVEAGGGAEPSGADSPVPGWAELSRAAASAAGLDAVTMATLSPRQGGRQGVAYVDPAGELNHRVTAASAARREP